MQSCRPFSFLPVAEGQLAAALASSASVLKNDMDLARRDAERRAECVLMNAAEVVALLSVELKDAQGDVFALEPVVQARRAECEDLSARHAAIVTEVATLKIVE